MYFTLDQLRTALFDLEKRQKDSKFFCKELRKDTHGKTTHPLKISINQIKDVKYGEHGRDYLAIDPTTGTIKCAACEGTADATVKEE